MNRSLWAVPLCLLLFASAFGQQKETPTPTIKRRAELVLVPTVVTLDGKPVTGLTAKDFVLLRDGRPEVVEVFEEIDASPAKVERVALPPRTVQNFAPADSRQDVVILVLDYLNSSWAARARIYSFLADITRQFVSARSPVSVFLLTRDGLIQLHSFASDLGNLAKAIERWQTGTPAITRPASQWLSPFDETVQAQTDSGFAQFDRYREMLGDATLRKAEMTADAIEQIAEAFRGVPGRKKMIWMSTGFPLAEEDSSAGVTFTSMTLDLKIADRVKRSWRSLSSANIAVYTIDSNGPANPSWRGNFSPEVSGQGRITGRPGAMKAASVENSSNTPSLLVVADKTAGRSCSEAPHMCIGEALADGTHYYMLGFYLHGDNKPGWHKLKVSVSESKAGVRARDGFVIAPEPSGKPGVDKEEVNTALIAPLDYTSVPLRLTWSALPAQGKEVQLELVLFSPPGGVTVNPDDSRVNLDYLAFIRPVGKTEGRTFPATLTTWVSPDQQKVFATAGFRFRKLVPLVPGRYEVRVFLRDNLARKTGTVSTLVDLSVAPATAADKSKP